MLSGSSMSQVCSHCENSPLADNGIRHATVRIRKLAKLGTMTRPSRMARHRSLTLNARKYDTGKPISRHSAVAVAAICRVPLNTLKNVSENTLP